MAKPNNQLGFYVNMDRCIGCRACEAACKQENNTAIGVRYRRVFIREGGKYLKPYRDYTSMACNHCDHPACAAACPVGVYTKREKDGVVVFDQSKCIGCRRCEWACPYRAPQFNAEIQKMEKCHFCFHRLDQDKGWKPACVQTCLALALEFGPVKELDDPKKWPGTVKTVADFADRKFTQPNIRFKPARRVK